MSHVVLLGDSIFDNGVYVLNQAPVIEQLRATLPDNWRATLCAVDGDVTNDVATQLKKAPTDADFLIISVGGNDALQQAGVLMQNVQTVGEAMAQMAEITHRFEDNYTAMLRAVLQKQLPTVICTIYNPRFSDPMMQTITVAALCHFNDVIIRAAVLEGLPLIDLRLICSEHGDYANDIEPSHEGGAKITRTIVRVVTTHDFNSQWCSIYC